jgi:ketosteroid isomerase-like protein
MSRQNVEVVREHANAYARGDVDRVLAALDPDVIFDFSARPDGGSICHGQEELLKTVRAWLGTWRDYHYETEEVIDAGDDRVVLLFSERGRGKASGVEVEHRGGWIYTLRNGKVVRATVYPGWPEALEAAGLRQQRAR